MTFWQKLCRHSVFPTLPLPLVSNVLIILIGNVRHTETHILDTHVGEEAKFC